MCYKKPGPRCSAHALAQLSKSRIDLLNFTRNEGTSEKAFEKEYLKKRKVVEKLEEEFYTTPVGLKEMQEELDNETDRIRRFKLETRINLCRQKRNTQLKAVKATVDEDRHNAENFVFQEYGTSNYGETSQSAKLEQMQAFLADSSNWSQKLTTDEIDAVRWYTKAGYISIYDYQQKGILTNVPSKEYVESKINNLNSALSKYERKEPIVVYRGLNKFNNSVLSHEEAKTAFKVDDEYSYESFSSTSLEPKIAQRFAVSQVIFEIKARKAVPIMALSVHSAVETELIIPPKERYRVVHVEPGNYSSFTKVQLEEI